MKSALSSLPLAALASWSLAQSYTNPVITEDFPDNDIFLGPDGKTFYFSSSNFHYSPGAPILQSTDLINWAVVGHSLPTLDFGPGYNMQDNQTNYNGGTWASTLRYRQSNDKWYWVGCINFWTTYVYTAPGINGPWRQSSSFQPCFYDCGMLIDDDDSLYVAYGSNNVSVAKMTPDGLKIAVTQRVFDYPPECTGVEGNRMYKRDGFYYILNDCPSNGITLVWKASSPFGPYTRKVLNNGTPGPIPGIGSPIQGSLIKTRDASWYFMSFAWAYPLGRVPVLAPITWDSDGYPVLQLVNGTWGTTYPYPLPKNDSQPGWIGSDQFWGNSLNPNWEWNHNPDTFKFSFNNPGLTLSTATITNDLFHARNTLTRRIDGNLPIGTVQLDIANMQDGDVCGLAAFKDRAAYIGVTKDGNQLMIQTVYDMTQDANQRWATVSLGNVVSSVPLPSSTSSVWLQVALNVLPGASNTAEFRYSLDGSNFRKLGESPFQLTKDWHYFPAYRYGIFNYATKVLGGSIKVNGFTSWRG